MLILYNLQLAIQVIYLFTILVILFLKSTQLTVLIRIQFTTSAINTEAIKCTCMYNNYNLEALKPFIT